MSRVIYGGKLHWMEIKKDGTPVFMPINKDGDIEITHELAAKIIGQEAWENIIMECALGKDWRDFCGPNRK